ncbi:MAG: hypothetical protein JNM17_13220 [Archangium sp.]|nr:hypothetical protein [Archangium sp.]
MTDPSECYSETSFALCDGTKWVEFPCADRCSNVKTPVCAFKRGVGTACPVSWEGSAYCDGNTFVTCQSGKWANKMTCSSCDESAGFASCRP